MVKKDFLKLRVLIHSELKIWFSYSQKNNFLYGTCLNIAELSNFCERFGFDVDILSVGRDTVVICSKVR